MDFKNFFDQIREDFAGGTLDKKFAHGTIYVGVVGGVTRMCMASQSGVLDPQKFVSVLGKCSMSDYDCGEEWEISESLDQVLCKVYGYGPPALGPAQQVAANGKKQKILQDRVAVARSAARSANPFDSNPFSPVPASANPFVLAAPPPPADANPFAALPSASAPPSGDVLAAFPAQLGAALSDVPDDFDAIFSAAGSLTGTSFRRQVSAHDWESSGIIKNRPYEVNHMWSAIPISFDEAKRVMTYVYSKTKGRKNGNLWIKFCRAAGAALKDAENAWEPMESFELFIQASQNAYRGSEAEIPWEELGNSILAGIAHIKGKRVQFYGSVL
jgi:hypothetical protein